MFSWRGWGLIRVATMRRADSDEWLSFASNDRWTPGLTRMHVGAPRSLRGDDLAVPAFTSGGSAEKDALPWLRTMSFRPT